MEDEHVAQGGAVKIVRTDPCLRAMVGFWLDSADDRAPCEAALAAWGSGLAGYLVVESRPMVHHPPVGERAPGANLVTLINRLPGMEDEAFFEHWNNEHRKVALETQSTTAYVRNAVVRPLTPGAPQRDGIVEETFPMEALTDPHVWYDCSDEEEYQRRMLIIAGTDEVTPYPEEWTPETAGMEVEVIQPPGLMLTEARQPQLHLSPPDQTA